MQTRPQSKYPRTIFLLNDDDVDSTAESRGIQRVVGIPHGAKRVPHVLHAMALEWEASSDCSPLVVLSVCSCSSSYSEGGGGVDYCGTAAGRAGREACYGDVEDVGEVALL